MIVVGAIVGHLGRILVGQQQERVDTIGNFFSQLSAFLGQGNVNSLLNLTGRLTL